MDEQKKASREELNLHTRLTHTLKIQLYNVKYDVKLDIKLQICTKSLHYAITDYCLNACNKSFTTSTILFGREFQFSIYRHKKEYTFKIFACA